MKRTRQKTTSHNTKFRKLIIRVTIFLLMFTVLATAYYNIPALKVKEVNGTVLTGILTEDLIIEEPDGAIKIGQGESYSFGVYLQYTDKDGNQAKEEIADKSELSIRSSDASVCERTEYNVITINDDIETGTIFTITLTYRDITVDYTFMVAYSLKATVKNGVVTNPDDNAVLVKRNRVLPKQYVPDNLVEPSIQFRSSVDDDEKYLISEAAVAAERLFLVAKNNGYSLIALKGYDTGTSDPEHQTGLALDVTSITSNYSTGSTFANSAEGQWLAKHAAEYGFVIRYPLNKYNKTGFEYSPSHLRYLGEELATYLYENGLTLDEYLQ